MNLTQRRTECTYAFLFRMKCLIPKSNEYAVTKDTKLAKRRPIRPCSKLSGTNPLDKFAESIDNGRHNCRQTNINQILQVQYGLFVVQIQPELILNLKPKQSQSVSTCNENKNGEQLNVPSWQFYPAPKRYPQYSNPPSERTSSKSNWLTCK